MATPSVKMRVFGPIPPASGLLKGAGSGPGGQPTTGRLWFGNNRAAELQGNNSASNKGISAGSSPSKSSMRLKTVLQSSNQIEEFESSSSSSTRAAGSQGDSPPTSSRSATSSADSTSKGWVGDLFVLGPGHQQHPQGGSFPRERWSWVKVGMFPYLTPLPAQVAPCGAPEGTGPHRSRGLVA